MTAAVTSEMRHTKRRRCPICEGAEQDARGQGKRCTGFTSADGEWVHCSREEYAGGLPHDTAGTFAHRMHGPCKCGTSHGPELRSVVDDVVATYVYTDEAGVPLYRVLRTAAKQFFAQHPDGAGGWAKGLNGQRRVPYRLHELVKTDPSTSVYIVEGEKDCDSLTKRGLSATCNPFGAGKFAAVAEVARAALTGRHVLIVADADEVGRKHAREVHAAIASVAASVTLLEPPAPHKDITDLLEADGSLSQLVSLVADVPPSADPKPESSPPSGVRTLAQRAADIRNRGRVVRLPTGLTTLDANCRGGFAIRRLVIIGGAPGAGKTALLVWLAWMWAKAGIHVAILAVDESADDILMRLALLEGFDVAKLEECDPAEWTALESRVAELPLSLFDGDEDGMMLEDVAAHLARESDGKPAVLGADSLQLIRAVGTDPGPDGHEKTPKQRVDANIRACKQIAKANPFVMIVTSELGRAAYRSRKTAEQVDPLAAFKESGGIEYGAQTALVLRSVPDGDGTVEVDIPKNRGGRKDPFFLAIDSRTQIREVSAPECAAPASPQQRSHDDTAKVLTVLAEKGCVNGLAAMRAELKSRFGIGKDRTDAAVALLGVREAGETNTTAQIENRGTKQRPRWHRIGGAA